VLRVGPRGWAAMSMPLLWRRPRAAAVTRLPGWTSRPMRAPRALSAPASTSFAGSGPGDQVRLVWVGRLDPPKRPDLLLDLARELAACGKHVSLRVMGAAIGERPPAWDRPVAGLDVQFLGHVPDPWEVATPDEIVVMLSDSEAVNFVVQEAMSRGRVVVSRPLPSIDWLAGDAYLSFDTAADTAVQLAGSTDAELADLGRRASQRYQQMLPLLATPDDLAADTLGWAQPSLARSR
jgi:glycosyltransferase involved in cell wall biosynthesis